MPDHAIRWTVRLFAALGVLVGGFALLSIIVGGPGRGTPMPWVSPGAPFGTYVQSTQLGLLTLSVGFAFVFAGGRPRSASVSLGPYGGTRRSAGPPRR